MLLKAHSQVVATAHTLAAALPAHLGLGQPGGGAVMPGYMRRACTAQQRAESES